MGKGERREGGGREIREKILNRKKLIFEKFEMNFFF